MKQFSPKLLFFIFILFLSLIFADSLLAYSPIPYRPLKLRVITVEGDIPFVFQKKEISNDTFVAANYLEVETPSIYDAEISLKLLKNRNIHLETDSPLIDICYYRDAPGDYSAHCSKNVSIADPQKSAIWKFSLKPSGDFGKASEAFYCKWDSNSCKTRFSLLQELNDPSIQKYKDILTYGEKQDLLTFDVRGNVGGKSFVIKGTQFIDFTPESLQKYENAVYTNYQRFRRSQELGPYIFLGILATIFLVSAAIVISYHRRKRKSVSIGKLIYLQELLLLLVIFDLVVSLLLYGIQDFQILFSGFRNGVFLQVEKAQLVAMLDILTLLVEGTIIYGFLKSFRWSYLLSTFLFAIQGVVGVGGTLLHLFTPAFTETISLAIGILYCLISILSLLVWKKLPQLK